MHPTSKILPPCGFYYYLPGPSELLSPPQYQYIPQVKIEAHATIFSSVARTTLSQTFVNPSESKAIDELRYTFPLFDGVSVVDFTCTIGKRVIRGVVKERSRARQAYRHAVSRGESAALVEQLPDASDVFITTVGNVPAGAELHVELVYLGELKHDAEVDGIRYTIPTSIAPRYGSHPGDLAATASQKSRGDGIKITVDAEMPSGAAIKSMQSPSHKISLHVGVTSTANEAPMSLERAHLTLTDGEAALDRDFVVQIVTQNAGDPVAMLEEHPTLPNHRALMATLVPRFSLPSCKPEIVFVCDRSGSMGGGNRIPNLKRAIQTLLKSLPPGVKFNICSFGSKYSFLWKKSHTYGERTVREATRYVAAFRADFGGTEIQAPLEETFKRRYRDMNLEIFLLTDGQIWQQESLVASINKEVASCKGSCRIFTLGIGDSVSHALIESVARAGRGFAQTVADTEKMDAKIVRMLRASLTPHVNDYSLEVKYSGDDDDDDDDNDDEFELVEKVQDALVIHEQPPAEPASAVEKEVISLFDKTADPDQPHPHDTTSLKHKYDHLPKVAAPKMLQAPVEIPPLFSFSRTYVYLLFSPAAPQRPIKSLVLCGTCKHGPLQLEIPVTTLSAKGETVHQLAARKAVQELEEGRGWLTLAKDGSGELLSETHSGRFSDMVEREAVRLGLQYRVGGKWCSFVAVETKDAEEDDDGETSAGVDTCPTTSPEHASTRLHACLEYNHRGELGVVRHRRLLESPHETTTPRPRTRLMKKTIDTSLLTRHENFCPAPPPFPPGHALPSAAPTPDAVATLVFLQHFDGSWPAALSSLWTTVGITRRQAEALLPDLKPNPDVLATVVAVAFLKAKWTAERDTWDMLVEKAVGWVCGEMACDEGRVADWVDACRAGF